MSNSKKNILIVDDDVDFLTQIKFHLQNLGYSVSTAESQKEGEKYLETNKPDLLIVDLMMENEDSGFILAYKSKKKYPDVPVIIATAVTTETGMVFGVNHQEEKNWIKADLYLEKNLRPDQLEREVKRLLKS
jgi:two-component system, OmpR family, response regulator